MSWRNERRYSVGACLKGTCRDDPIPPGVYWIDVPWEDSLQTGVPKPQHFQLWLDGMRNLGWVKLISTVHHEGSDIGEYAGGLGEDQPARDWHLFQVMHETPRWTPATGLGLPTVAPHGIQTTEDDTIQSPQPKTISESIWDSILPSSTSGKIIVASVAIGGAALIIHGMTRD